MAKEFNQDGLLLLYGPARSGPLLVPSFLRLPTIVQRDAVQARAVNTRESWCTTGLDFHKHDPCISPFLQRHETAVESLVRRRASQLSTIISSLLHCQAAKRTWLWAANPEIWLSKFKGPNDKRSCANLHCNSISEAVKSVVLHIPFLWRRDSV